MAKKKKSDTIYIVGWRFKNSWYPKLAVPLPDNLKWTYCKVFTDYEEAGMYVDIERRLNPHRVYKIEEH